MRGRLTVFVCAIVAALVIGIGTPGSANVITRSDGNDTKGPLDLAGVKLTHSGATKHVFQVTTISGFANAEVDGNTGWIEIDFDLNADRRFDRAVVILHSAGRFQGVVITRSGTVLDRVSAGRVSARAVKVTVPVHDITPVGSYDFAVASVWRAAPCSKSAPCIDTIPNRYPLMRHDYKAPQTAWILVPVVSTDASATLTFPIKFNVTENSYGSGLKSWTLQKRQVGDSIWLNAASGSTKSATVSVPGSEGETWEFRVRAVDKQGNRSTSSIQRVTVPWDDANSVFTYSLATVNAAVTGAFLGSTTSLAKDGTATLTVSTGWTQLCVVGGPLAGSVQPGTVASVSIDGGPPAYAGESTTTPNRTKVLCLGPQGAGTHQVVITTVQDEPFVFDGITIRP